jgi:hypothetical protein
MARFGVRSGSVVFARSAEHLVSKRFKRTGANARKRRSRCSSVGLERRLRIHVEREPHVRVRFIVSPPLDVWIAYPPASVYFASAFQSVSVSRSVGGRDTPHSFARTETRAGGVPAPVSWFTRCSGRARDRAERVYLPMPIPGVVSGPTHAGLRTPVRDRCERTVERECCWVRAGDRVRRLRDHRCHSAR